MCDFDGGDSGFDGGDIGGFDDVGSDFDSGFEDIGSDVSFDDSSADNYVIEDISDDAYDDDFAIEDVSDETYDDDFAIEDVSDDAYDDGFSIENISEDVETDSLEQDSMDETFEEIDVLDNTESEMDDLSTQDLFETDTDEDDFSEFENAFEDEYLSEGSDLSQQDDNFEMVEGQSYYIPHEDTTDTDAIDMEENVEYSLRDSQPEWLETNAEEIEAPNVEVDEFSELYNAFENEEFGTNTAEFSENAEEIEQSLRDYEEDNAPLSVEEFSDDTNLDNDSTYEMPTMTDGETEPFTFDGEDMIISPPEDYDVSGITDASLEFEQEHSYPYNFNPEIAPEVHDFTNEPETVGERAPVQGGDGGEWERAMADMPTFEEHMEQIAQANNLEPLSSEEMNAVYEGLDEYDFQGADIFEDTERLDASLESFTTENWEKLDLTEQKAKMTDLATYISDAAEIKNPPKIEFYSSEKDGEYGGFDRATNTLRINEHMIYQNDEAADTVAHELWHARQYERASNPKTKLDLMYAENFKDYISCDEDYEAYYSQILESEARAFAAQLKDRLHSYN